MDWVFSGIGTLLIGLLLGGTAGTAVGWRIGVVRTKQSQKAGAKSRQTQVGGNYERKK